jgi:hypothetical protein
MLRVIGRRFRGDLARAILDVLDVLDDAVE